MHVYTVHDHDSRRLQLAQVELRSVHEQMTLNLHETRGLN